MTDGESNGNGAGHRPLPEEYRRLLDEDRAERAKLHEQTEILSDQLDRLDEVLNDFTDRMFLPLTEEDDEISAVRNIPRRQRSNG